MELVFSIRNNSPPKGDGNFSTVENSTDNLELGMIELRKGTETRLHDLRIVYYSLRSD